MDFIEQYLDGIETPLLLPPHVTPLTIVDGSVRYVDIATNTINNDEPLMHHDGRHVVLNQYRAYFPTDEVIVFLRTLNGDLLYHRRSYQKLWEPGKIDMVSVVGKVRAINVGHCFVSEGYDAAARRELIEETGLPETMIAFPLAFMGSHYNSLTDSYQQVYCSVFNQALAVLNQYSQEHSDHEVEEWFQGDYHKTLDYYSGPGSHEHAGGAEIFKTCFIANPDIRSKLSAYFKT